MKTRTGEDQKTRFRTERIILIDQNYFFSTREGAEIGPFKSKPEAELALARYIKVIGTEGGSLEHAERVATQGVWARSLYT